VMVDACEYLEGFDLDVDDFYALYAEGHRPTVEFGQPSPGQFAVAYDDLIGRGCTHILSIHTSAAVSGTLKAARLAAHSAPVPIRLVDSRTARFGVSCCVWATAEAVASGASVDEAALVAESMASKVCTVFTVDGLDLVGHDTSGAADAGACGGRVNTVSTLVKGRPAVVCEVTSLVEAVNAMAAFTLRAGWKSVTGQDAAGHDGADLNVAGLNVAVGWAHQSLQPVAEALTQAITGCSHIREVVQFRIGPSVGVETGPGTVGCVFYPA
jgi:fatty acid-binding protein DegV